MFDLSHYIHNPKVQHPARLPDADISKKDESQFNDVYSCNVFYSVVRLILTVARPAFHCSCGMVVEWNRWHIKIHWQC